MLPISHAPLSPKRRISPLFLLLNVNLLEKPPYLVTMSDLEQIEDFGTFLFGARSHEDSFRIFRIFMIQATAMRADICQMFPFILRGAIHLTKNATTNEDRARVIELLKTFTPKTLKFNSSCSIQCCLLYSYLGNCYRLQGNTVSAEKYCDLALHNFRGMGAELCRPGLQAIIIEHLILVQQERKLKKWEDLSVDSRIGKLRKQRFGFPDWERTHEVNVALAEIFQWCSTHLFHGPLAKVVHQVDVELWTKAPSDIQLAGFLTTLLFCYLWKHLDVENPDAVGMKAWGTYRPAFRYMQELCGMSPVETLSVVARMIIGSVSTYAQLAIAGAVAGAAKKTAEQRHLRSMDVFLDAFVAPLREHSPRFTSASYTFLVQTFLHYFVEENFDLQLSEGAFGDPRMRPLLVHGSILPSSTATMIPTPHSSRNKSTTSISKRLSWMIRISEQMPPWGTSSSPRWGHRSVLSMATTVSSYFSARFSSRRTSTMELVKEPPQGSGKMVGRTYIFLPTLVSTSNSGLMQVEYAGEYSKYPNFLYANYDRMDINDKDTTLP